MDIPYNKNIEGFHVELSSCLTRDSVIFLLIRLVNSSIKAAQYERGHAILDYARQNFMRRNAIELSQTEKFKLLKMQIRRSIIFMSQNNKGGSKLMISVADNLQKKLGKNFASVEALKRLVEVDNAHQIVCQVVKDDRFDLNNLQVTIKLLLDKINLSSKNSTKSPTNQESSMHQLKVRNT